MMRMGNRGNGERYASRNQTDSVSRTEVILQIKGKEMSGNVSSEAGQALFVSGIVFCVKYIDKPALFFPGGRPPWRGVRWSGWGWWFDLWGCRLVVWQVRGDECVHDTIRFAGQSVCADGWQNVRFSA